MFFKENKFQLTVAAKWADLVALYHDEKENDVHITSLMYASLHPTNVEKQKRLLVQNIFNEKTIAALQLKAFDETATFISYITKTWNILNVKSPEKGYRLNDKNKDPMRSADG